MSALDEELANRRATKERIRSFTLAKSETRTLVLNLWQGDQWILPWAQFVSARLGKNESGHHLEISFASVRVLLTGENLGGLMEPLASFRVSDLCDLPPQFAMHGEKGEPYVSRLEVRPVPSTLGIRETPD